MERRKLGFLFILVLIAIIEVKGLGIPNQELPVSSQEIEITEAKGKEKVRKDDRKGRTFGFLNYNNYGPGPGPLGPRPPYQPGPVGPMPPPPPPSYYQSYYDSGPVIFIRQIGSMIMYAFLQMLLTPSPPQNGPMEYPYDYDGGPGESGPPPPWQSDYGGAPHDDGPPPPWQSEFDGNEYN